MPILAEAEKMVRQLRKPEKAELLRVLARAIGDAFPKIETFLVC